MNIDFGFITCNEYKELTADDKILFKALEQRGYNCQPLVWDNPKINWRSIRVSILRSAWEYHLKYGAFQTWLDFVSTETMLVNSAALVRENINKRYLERIAKEGISVIPTVYLERSKKVNISSIMKDYGWPEIIVKPAIGLSAFGIKRIDDSSNLIVEGQKHLNELLQSGDVLVQPYFDSVQNYGERNLIFIDGTYSHCVRKMRFQAVPKTGEARDTLVEADHLELSLAKTIIESVDPKPFYARVDLLRDPNSLPCLIELELIDPKLFFSLHQPAVERFAEGIISLLKDQD